MMLMHMQFLIVSELLDLFAEVSIVEADGNDTALAVGEDIVGEVGETGLLDDG